ncbi:hypothetical protein [[Pseudomonas] boreopolis]|uniref:hypothetical protein n=1 Tax=Xanthomonas boreopolis TaxID=86183 RepID=UPI003D9BA21A
MASPIQQETLMARESRYEIETYLLHDIRVRVHRERAGDAWRVRVDVRRPNGEHCRRIEDDTPWPQAEQAVLEGFRLGRTLVNNGEC